MKPILVRRALVATALVSALALLVFPGHADVPPGRYTVANGTVYDSVTQLTWQQMTAPSTYTQAQGMNYCTNNTATLPGMGWRLPTKKELLTIVDYSRTTYPLVDLTAFPDVQNNTKYWSTTPAPPNGTPYAWYVSYFNGSADRFDRTAQYVVRCVR